MDKATFEALYGTSGTVFPDNTTGDISEGDLRGFGQAIKDSFLSTSDNFIDEDSFASDSATKAPSQQSTKAFILAQLGSIGTVASGTYTPTATTVLNVSAVTVTDAQYMRVGSVVTVSGTISIDAVATGVAQVRMTLPIASNLSWSHQLAGVVVTMTTSPSQYGAVYGDAANNEAVFYVTANSISNNAHAYTFTYLII